MSILNAASSDEAVILSPIFGGQFDYQNQDPNGPNSANSYSWITSDGDDMTASGTGMDFTDPSPDSGNVTSLSLDLLDDGDTDVTVTSITGLNGGGAIASARLGVMVDGLEQMFNEIMSFDDNVTGSAFNDIFKLGGGDDTLNAGSGNDSASGGDGDDSMNGSSGNDTLTGDAGSDTLNGGSNNDSLNGGSEDDSLQGSSGNDTLTGGTGADSMNGGDQNDTYSVDNTGDVTAESFNDAIGGVDLVNASATHTIGFGIEHLTLTGTGNINGTGNGNGNNITGNSGNNLLNGGDGADSLLGNSGNDTLSGGTGNDTARGGSGNDTVNGNDGADSLSGDSGADSLVGGAGNDTLTGGSGQDAMAGNAGADVFDFNLASESAPAARDTINGFDGAGGAAGDVIDLSGIDAIAGGANDAFFFLGHIQAPFPPPTAPGSLWVRNEGGNTHVYGNLDGDFTPEFALQIVDGAVGAASYTAADFIL